MIEIPRACSVSGKRRERAEEVGADEAEIRAPEREDDERDRDPAGPGGEPVLPLRQQREAEAGTRDAGESAAREGVRVPVAGDRDPHGVRRRGRLADGAHVQAVPGAGEVEADGGDAEPRDVDEPVLVEDDRAEDRQVAETEQVDGPERESGRVVRQGEVVADVRRQAGRAGEDRQRETRDDLVRAERDHEERQQERHRRTRQPGDQHRHGQRDPGRAAQLLHGEKAGHRTDQHHPLDAEVEHTGTLREQLAERGVQQRRAVRDRGRQHDDDDARVHEAASAARRPPRPIVIRYWTSSSPPSIANRINPCITPTRPEGNSALWSV